MSTDNPSRPEDEAPARTARDKSVDTGGTPATGEPSLEVPALAPVLDADGEILDMQEAPPTQAAQTTPAAQAAQTAQSDSDATPVTPTANGPGSGTATPHTPQHGAPRTATPPPGTPRTATPHTPQHGTYASGAVAAENTGTPPQEPPASAGPANPAQGMPDSLPGQAEPAGSAEPSDSVEPGESAAPTAPAAGGAPAGGAAADPLNLEKPEPIVLTPDTGQHDEAAEEPVEDTAVRRRSLFTPAQPAQPTQPETRPEPHARPETGLREARRRDAGRHPRPTRAGAAPRR